MSADSKTFYTVQGFTQAGDFIALSSRGFWGCPEAAANAARKQATDNPGYTYVVMQPVASFRLSLSPQQVQFLPVGLGQDYVVQS